MVWPHAVGGSAARGPLFAALLLALSAAPGISGAEVVMVDRRFVLTDSAEVRPPGPGGAVLWIAREQFVRVQPLPPEAIYLDGEPAGLLTQRSWFEVPLTPGEHHLCGIAGVPGFTLRCAAGDSIFLRLRELIDTQDQRTMEWLYDDPADAADLFSRSRLRHVQLTAYGARNLAGKRPRGCADEKWPAPVAAPETFDHVLIERPLDQVNLQTEFHHLAGRLWLDGKGVHYRMGAWLKTSLVTSRWVSDSLDVPADSITRVRFGGTRFTGVTPWVTLDIHTARGPSYVSFADLREEDGVGTYNRLFERLIAMRRASHDGAEPH